MKTTEQKKEPKHVSGMAGRRSLHFFFLLAAFNVLTVSFSLFLNHQLVTTQRKSVAGNQVWVSRLALCDVLSKKSGDVNAPANNVLESFDVKKELAARDAAIATFNESFQELQQRLTDDVQPADAERLKKDMAEVRREFDALVDETSVVFDLVRDNQRERFLSENLVRSHKRTAVLAAMDHLRTDMRALRKTYLMRQLAEAHNLAKWEWLLGGLMFLMVVGAVVHGVQMKRRELAVESERQRTEQQLLVRSRAMEAAANAIVITDSAGKIMWVNPAFTRLTGYTAAEAVGQNPRVLKSGRHDNDFYRTLWMTVLSGNAWSGEMINRRKDGSLYTEHMTITPVCGLDGEDTCFVAIKEDISDRKQAEFKTMLLEAQAQTSIDGLLAVDSGGHTLLYNQRFAEMWRIPQQILDTKDDKQMLDYVLQQLAEPMEFIRKVGYLYEHKDEKSRDEIVLADERWFDRFSTPLLSADGTYQGRLWNFRDITDRKQSELALRDNTALLGSLLGAIPVPVFYKDCQGIYIGINTAYEELLGKTHDELVGKSVYDIAPRELADVYHAKDTELIQNPGLQVYTSQMKDAQGRMHDVVFHKATFHDSGGKVAGLVGAILDITWIKKAEEEKEAMRAQLIQSQKLESIGTLAGGVAHEINNPINGIMNYSRLLMDRLSDKMLHEFASEIMRETERVATIVRNLLVFARPEMQSQSPARMCDIVQAVLSLIQSVMRDDQIALGVDVPEDLPSVQCRSQQVQQVLMNLLTNARDALNEKYPGADADKVIRLSARAIERDGGRWVRITVEDHGPGIPEELRQRIFDPFFSTKTKDKGTGLGLAITHGIVKDHGGRLTIESEVGKFTRMHMDLPVMEKA